MSQTTSPFRGIAKLLESESLRTRGLDDYKRYVRDHYDGAAGALTGFTGWLTGHESLAGRLFGPKAFDVRGCRHALDAACGNGRYSAFLRKHLDPGASLTGFDLSTNMLKRAAARPNQAATRHLAADLTRLPFANGTFDAAVCGWVLEHLPDPRPGLRELARVLSPGGKLLLMCTEDTLVGAGCSALWHCRTYNREELRAACEECGLLWHREYHFSPLHKRLRLGGIKVELRRSEFQA